MRKTLLLNRDDVHESVQISELIPTIEDTFAVYESGDAQMPPKSYIDLPQYNGDFRSMPAHLDAGDWDTAGIKWANVHPDSNDKYDLPTVMGTVIYSDLENAFPLALLDETELTMLHTGAATTVTTGHLTVEDASSMGIIGAGVQSHAQLRTIGEVRDVEEVVASDLDKERVADFIDAFEDEFDIRAGFIEEAMSRDVLSAMTPIESPIVPREAVGGHTHISAMGADAEGKHKLADEVLLDAKLVIDGHAQTTHSGEINVPYHDGIPTDDDIYDAIGDIVLGNLDDRADTDGISVFDSVGLAIQDVAATHVTYEHASENGNGYTFDLPGFAE